MVVQLSAFRPKHPFRYVIFFNGTVYLPGVVGTTSIGSFISTVTFSGKAGTASVGSLVSLTADSITGVFGSGNIGSLVSLTADRITGVFGSGNIGSFVPQDTETFSASGTGNRGSLVSQDTQTFSVSATGSRGSFVPQDLKALSAASGSGSVGSLTLAQLIATLIADNVHGRNNTILSGTETNAGTSAGEFDYWVLDSGNPYWIYQDGWGVGSGGNYVLTLKTYDTFPAGTDIDWSYSTSGSPVLSFQSVGWRGGTYGPPGINNFSGLNSVRLDHVTTLKFTFDFTSRGTQSLFGTAIDFAVTPTNDLQNGRTNQAFEILVALRYPSGAGTPDFTYTAAVSGINWSVILQDVGGSAPIEVVVWPTGDNWQTSGTFDILELFNQLASHAVVSHGNTFTKAGLYFGGFNFGCEPQGGSGGMTIHQFSVEYADNLGLGNNWDG